MKNMHETVKELLQKDKEKSDIIEQLEHKINEIIIKFEQKQNHQQQTIDQLMEKLQSCVNTIREQKALLESQAKQNGMQSNIIEHLMKKNQSLEVRKSQLENSVKMYGRIVQQKAQEIEAENCKVVELEYTIDDLQSVARKQKCDIERETKQKQKLETDFDGLKEAVYNCMETIEAQSKEIEAQKEVESALKHAIKIQDKELKKKNDTIRTLVRKLTEETQVPVESKEMVQIQSTDYLMPPPYLLNNNISVLPCVPWKIIGLIIIYGMAHLLWHQVLKDSILPFYI